MSRKRQERDNWKKNQATYKMYLDRLIDMYLSLFEWKGLPESINVRYLEMTLLEQGKVIFFYDENMGYLALNGNVTGFNVYNEPPDYEVYAPIGYHKTLNIDNAVVIWNTFRREPYLYVFEQYAERLFEITRTQDVNVKAQKTPVLIKTSDSQRLTMQNLYKQYDGNEPFIFGDKGLDTQLFEVLKTDAPFVADKLQVLKNEIWNEAMTTIGVNNAKQDKKERLVADEVAANDEQVEQMRDVMLDARKIACEQINKMFGLDISVDYKLRQKSDKMDDMEVEEIDEI